MDKYGICTSKINPRIIWQKEGRKIQETPTIMSIIYLSLILIIPVTMIQNRKNRLGNMLLTSAFPVVVCHKVWLSPAVFRTFQIVQVTSLQTFLLSVLC